MSVKQKGINAERELIHMFWKNGWAAIRVAGSGSSHYPSPDLLAGNNLRKLAIECKAISSNNKYLSSNTITQLSEFAEKFGAEPWIGIRFDSKGWYFLSFDDINKTKKGYSISNELAKQKGLLFNELIS